VTRRITPLCAIALAAAALLGTAAAADEQGAQPDRYDPRVAHRETDLNGDGYVDREEFQRRMMDVFFAGDSDKNGFMTRAELERAVIYPNDFDVADWKDGRISFAEFVRVRFEDYTVVDTDRDGMLSLEEIVAVFERGGVR
jgi:Ca2+-binding EF-hand superfamily protein